MSARSTSIARVFDELEKLYCKPKQPIPKFRDPIFTTRKDRIAAICDGVSRERLDLAWRCETAVNSLDRPLIERMAKAG